MNLPCKCLHYFTKISCHNLANLRLHFPFWLNHLQDVDPSNISHYTHVWYAKYQWYVVNLAKIHMFWYYVKLAFGCSKSFFFLWFMHSTIGHPCSMLQSNQCVIGLFFQHKIQTCMLVWICICLWHSAHIITAIRYMVRVIWRISCGLKIRRIFPITEPSWLS